MARFDSIVDLVLTALLAGTAVACGGQPQSAVPATHVYAFIDQSASLDGQQGEQWRKAVEGAARQLKAGDAVTVFPLHDHTADAAAIFAGATEASPPGAGVTRRTQDARALAAMKESAMSAVEEALSSPGRALWTDIFSAWDRIEPDPNGRHTVVLLLTDALHSTPALDLARVRLRPETFGSVIGDAAQAHRWTNETLRNVDVAFVLNGVEMGGKRAAVDRPTLRAFYDTLVRTLGGRLIGFDTELKLKFGRQS